MMPGAFTRNAIACGGFILLGGCGGTVARNDGTVDVRPLTVLVPELPEYTSRALTTAGSMMALPETTPFVREQLRHDRVRAARRAAEGRIYTMFRERNIDFPAAEVYLRVFKFDRALEVWVRPQGSERFQLLHTYRICALAGEPGPKRKQGDHQVPEGFYSIDFFNPNSSYHLSLRIDYPNRRDRAANTARVPLGGDIFIHGGCKSDGCLAMTDDGIRELYWLAVMARGLGQERIPVHIFPTRMEHTADLEKIKRIYRASASTTQFWRSLTPGYEIFQKSRVLPEVTVDERGRYQVSAAPFTKASQP